MTGRLQQSADTDQFTHGERCFFWSACHQACGTIAVQLREMVFESLVPEISGIIVHALHCVCRECWRGVVVYSRLPTAVINIHRPVVSGPELSSVS